MSSTCCTCACSEPSKDEHKTVKKSDSRLSWRDHWGSVKARLGLGRTLYRIKPGIYTLGEPGPDSEVLVTANYKLTFDALRRELPNRNLWILVLDTRGINVWCAAGKGTFSDAAILHMVELTKLDQVVKHRRLILPQLGAPGVSAHAVQKGCGFRVIYGPVRAADLPAFLDDGLRADAGMRQVRFPLRERLAVAQYEWVKTLKYIGLYVALVTGILVLTGSLNLMLWLLLTLPPTGAVFIGTQLVPLLLPVLPFRAFALKGAFLGVLWAGACPIFFKSGLLGWLGSLTLLPAISAFLALNYTGSSTFTSQSGVNREITLFARPMGMSALVGLIAFLLSVLL